MAEKTFIKITNKHVYNKLCDLESSIEQLKEHVIKTNGKVILNRWISTTGLTLITSFILIFISLKLKGVL